MILQSIVGSAAALLLVAGLVKLFGPDPGKGWREIKQLPLPISRTYLVPFLRVLGLLEIVAGLGLFFVGGLLFHALSLLLFALFVGLTLWIRIKYPEAPCLCLENVKVRGETLRLGIKIVALVALLWVVWRGECESVLKSVWQEPIVALWCVSVTTLFVQAPRIYSYATVADLRESKHMRAVV